MATKKAKSRKPLTSRTKGLICLVLLLALTVFVSCLAVCGMDLSDLKVLLPWVPVSSENWPVSLPVNRNLGGGTYTEYTYEIPEDADANALETSMKTMRARLDRYGESDAAVTEKDGVIRLDLRNMNASRRNNILSLITVPAQFEFSYGDTVVLTEKDIVGTEFKPDYGTSGNRLVAYILDMKISKEAQQKLAELDAISLAITMDGSSVGNGIVNGDKVELRLLNYNNDTALSNYNNLTTMDFMLGTSSIDVKLNNSASGTVNASMGIVLKVVLWLCAALLALTLIYTVVSGKLTGISATLSVWCAVMLGLFLVATVVVPTIMSLSVGCLIAILLGILLAIYTAVTRTDAISKQIGEGATPKSATKVGFRMSAKAVWIVQGAVIAVALILMIFAFSRSIGYCLSAGVLASAIAVVIMRAFQDCFTMMTGKASMFGKVK